MWLPFLLFISDMFLHLDWSPPVVNWRDWTFESHKPLYIEGLTADDAQQSRNHKVKNMPAELRQDR